MTAPTGSVPAFTVLHPGPLATVQDTGRPGYGALGIGPSGACDLRSYRLANRLVGNEEHAAALEITFGGLRLRTERTVTVCLTGARCPGVPHNAPVTLRPGDELHLGTPAAGLRTYLAVRGGVDARRVLGSRSTDLLAGLGPDPLAPGDRIVAFPPRYPHPGVDVAPAPDPASGPVTVALRPGPRADRFTGQAWRDLLGGPYAATSRSDRTGIRLDGPPLRQAASRELPSEGLTRGAIQVPPDGVPILFLADHPVTGGYPIIAYVARADIDRCAQLQPGQAVHFTRSPGGCHRPAPAA